MREKCIATGKSIFYSSAHAKNVIVHFKARHYNYTLGKRVNRRVKKTEQRRVYKCEFCNYYHLTSMDYYIEDYNKKRKK